MPRVNLKDLRVAVAGGGSLGGLCAGVALRGQGAKVDSYERHAGEMENRGAGIVVQQEVTSLLQSHGAPSLPTTGASAIKCCYAARGISASSALTQMVQCPNANMIPDAKNTIRDEKISLSVNCLLVNPACIAGVLTSRPNLSAL
jgi:2-polyprenyl-6-methoxyphenol hydroxylase-like FAD-dependent oxidoreductase